MRPRKFSYIPADDDTDALANDITGTGPWVPTATSAGDGLAHLISLNSAAALDGIDITLTGTDADDIPQTETRAGPGAGLTVYSSKYFKTLTGVSASSTLGANTMDVGYKDDCVTPTYPLNWRGNEFTVSLGVNVTGTINYTVQHCMQRMSDGPPSTLTWWPHSSLASKTADADGNYGFPVTAIRLHINSLTAGALVDFHVTQAN